MSLSNSVFHLNIYNLFLVESLQCGADMKLDFSGTTHEAFDDKSRHPQSIGVFDVVQTMKEQAMFNGRGSLKLWRFSNVELGPELAIKFRFYAHGRSMRSETLLSNCIGKKDAAAIDIRIETDILEIIFTVKTTKSPETHMRMFYKVSINLIKETFFYYFIFMHVF